MVKWKESIKNSSNTSDYTATTDKTTRQNGYQLLSSLIIIESTLVQEDHHS